MAKKEDPIYIEIINQGVYYNKSKEEQLAKLSSKNALHSASLAMIKSLYPAETGDSMEAGTGLTKSQFGEQKITEKAIRDIHLLVSDYQKAISEEEGGFAGQFQDPKRLGDLEGMQANILARTKDAFELGALDEGVFKLVEELVGTKPQERIWRKEEHVEERTRGKINQLLGELEVRRDTSNELLSGVDSDYETPDAIKEKLSATVEYAQNNPDDPKGQEFLKDWNNNNIDLQTGEIINKSPQQMTPYELKEAELKEAEEAEDVTQYGGSIEQFQSDIGEMPEKAVDRATGGSMGGATLYQTVASPEFQAAYGGAVNDVIGASFNLAMPRSAEKAIGAMVAKGMEMPVAKQVVEGWQSFDAEHPKLARDIANMGIAMEWMAGKVGGSYLKNLANSAKTKQASKVKPETIIKETEEFLSKAQTKHAQQLKDLSRTKNNLKKFTVEAEKKGFNVEEDAAKSGVMKGTVDKNGTVTTIGKGGALEQYKAQEIGDLDKKVSEGLKAEGKSVEMDDAIEYINKVIEEDVKRLTGTAGTKAKVAIKKEIETLRQEGDTVSLERLNDLKASIYHNLNYKNPDVATGQKTAVRGLKEYIEKNSDDVAVKELNAELTQKYATADYIELLDGAKVEGGRVMKHVTATTSGVAGGLTGMALGSVFGPVGAAVGAASGTVMAQSIGRSVQGAKFQRYLK